MRIFGVRILVRIFGRIFFARRPQGGQQKNPAKKASLNPPPNLLPQNLLSKNPPQNPPQIPLRIFASRSSLGLGGDVGAHLDALVEVGSQSRQLPWQQVAVVDTGLAG